jgi:AAA family ATP:ADP antiporter
MEHKNVFYACVYPFLAFFALFALAIYPNRGLLHPHGLVDMLAANLPAGFSAPLAIVRNWSFAVFYVMAEMWGSVVTSLLFWGFANEVTTVEEAKKYCTCQISSALRSLLELRPSHWNLSLSLDPLFGLGANVALIFSGQYVRWVSNMRSTLAPGVDAWAVSLKYLMGAVMASGGVLVATYKHMQDNVVKKVEGAPELKDFPRKKKTRMTMKESAKFLLSSPYIRDLALLVISYGMCINIVEVSWKSKLKVRSI